MSEMHEYWPEVNLGEVTSECRERNDGSFSWDDLFGVTNSQGMIPMKDRVRGKSLDRYKIVRSGDFAYNPMRINVGSIARWTGLSPVVVSPDYVVFRTDPERLDSEFLDHVRRSASWAEFVKTAGAGSVRTRIYYKDLADYPLPTPPLPEQRKIAAILSSVDAVIEKTEAVIEQLQVVKKAMTQELLTRGLPGRHVRFKQTEIGEIPAEWEVVPCGDLFEVQLGKMMSQKARSGPNQVPYLRNQNVYWEDFDLEDLATMHFDAREQEKYRLQPGAVLACAERHRRRSARR